MLSTELISYVYNKYSNVTPESYILEDIQFIAKCRSDISDLKQGILLFPSNMSIYESEIKELEETITELQNHIEEMKNTIKQYGPRYK